jgi:outer membrane protein assembly factor BamB
MTGQRCAISAMFSPALSLTLLVPAAAHQTRPPASVVGFRGDAAHTGVYSAPTPEAYAGLAWRFQTGGTIVSSPAVAGLAVYVGSNDGHLYALDRASGRMLWAFDAKSGVSSSPLVSGDLVAFTSADGHFFALDATSGRLRWRLPTGPEIPFPWGHESGDIWTSSPAYADGLLLVGAGDGRLYAVDARSGKVRWRLQTAGRIRSSPAVAGGVVYVGSADGTFYAADLQSGRERWRFDTEGHALESGKFGFDRRTIQSSPAVAGDLVVFGARDGFLYALDRTTGRERWRYDHKVSWVNGSPAIADGVVYVGTSDTRFVHALDLAHGTERWRFSAKGLVWSSVAVAGDAVVVSEGGGLVHVLDRATGKERWQVELGAGIFSSPVVVGDAIYVGSHDGGVYALRAAPASGALRRAMFWDSAYTKVVTFRPHQQVRSYLAGRGYEELTAGGLKRFLEARVADRAPSVVVFPIDYVPAEVAPVSADSVLFRRYLNAGGKVVWLGLPPMIVKRDVATGDFAITDINRQGPRDLLGVSHGHANFDPTGAQATPAGSAWGLSGWCLSDWSADPADVTETLALDEQGLAAAWLKSYGGPPGTGFVRLYGAQWTSAGLSRDQLASIWIAAERLPVSGSGGRS